MQIAQSLVRASLRGRRAWQLTCCFIAAAFVQANAADATIRLRVDLGDDVGQCLGTLFEGFDANGNAVVGAGFLDAYNTQDRSDRRMLHVYVRGKAPPAMMLEPLPRPTSDGGTYLFGFDGQLFATGRGGGSDHRLRRWNESTRAWEVDESTVPFSVAVGDGALTTRPQTIAWRGKPLLELPENQGSFAESYQALGWLVVRRHNRPTDRPSHELIAYRWRPGMANAMPSTHGRIVLPAVPTVVYAFAHFGDDILVATNTGGVYAFDVKTTRWRAIREPTPKVSFQIYSSVRFHDRLLLGQYPTGELFDYSKGRLERLAAWPPVMPGVSGGAREAQTTAIFGGDLLVGVWPWGEVWRQDRDSARWSLLGRLFTQPAPTKTTTHPYENETKRLDPVLNRWGQRVTSMVPLGDSLYLATSAKSQAPFEPKFSFLADGRWKEYGAVYRWRRPGCLAVPMRWTGQPTTFEVRLDDDLIEVRQDNAVIGATQWGRNLSPGRVATVRWGNGVFGKFSGRIEEQAVVPALAAKQPFLATYLDLQKCFDRDSPIDVRQAAVDQTLDRVKACGLNVVMPYANTSSWTVHYDSAHVADRSNRDWEPLTHAVAAGRRRGLKVWPAVCVFACGQFQPKGILLRHPHWALRTPDGQPYGFISPTHPEARRWLIAALREMVRKQQPDGVLLDYLRYFNREWLLDAASETAVQKTLDSEPPCNPAARRRRRLELAGQMLTEFTRDLVAALRAEKPDLKIGVYTWGPHVVQGHLVCQDWRAWAREGLIDMVNVSGYYYPEQNGPDYLATFSNRMREAVQFAAGAGRPLEVTFALGVHTSHGKIPSIARMAEYLRAGQAAGVSGVAVFSWSAFDSHAVDAGKARLFDAFRPN